MRLRRYYRSLTRHGKIHFVLLLVWLGPGMVVSFMMRESVPWLVSLSVYAIVAAHWSGLEAAEPDEPTEQ